MDGFLWVRLSHVMHFATAISHLLSNSVAYSVLRMLLFLALTFNGRVIRLLALAYWEQRLLFLCYTFSNLPRYKVLLLLSFLLE